MSTIDPDPAETPGQFLKRLLKALDETKASASRKSRIHNTLLGKWENDETEPGIKNARKLADGLGVSRFVVMVGLGILEPEDAALDPALGELAVAFALVPEGSERERMRTQIEFIAAMARDRVAGAVERRPGEASA